MWKVELLSRRGPLLKQMFNSNELRFFKYLSKMDRSKFVCL